MFMMQALYVTNFAEQVGMRERKRCCKNGCEIRQHLLLLVQNNCKSLPQCECARSYLRITFGAEAICSLRSSCSASAATIAARSCASVVYALMRPPATLFTTGFSFFFVLEGPAFFIRATASSFAFCAAPSCSARKNKPPNTRQYFQKAKQMEAGPFPNWCIQESLVLEPKSLGVVFGVGKTETDRRKRPCAATVRCEVTHRQLSHRASPKYMLVVFVCDQKIFPQIKSGGGKEEKEEKGEGTIVPS